ncbi:MAG TPA: hypothetical protein VGN00_02145 [Puia sp.]|jgi:hypothetical protein
MQKFIQKSLFMVLVGMTALMQPVLAGTDSYRIYLNNKLILQQYVTRTLDLKNLPLSEANANDKLVIYYNHCGATGRNRSIVVKDENGVVLKEWKFADAPVKDGGMNIPAGDDGMTIPVKEILALQEKSHGLSLYYSSQQLPAGHLLTRVDKVSKPVA